MLLVKLLFAVIEPVLTPPSPPVLLWQHIGLILLERHVNKKNKTTFHELHGC